MPITYVGAGALEAQAGPATPALPGSLAIDDILILCGRTVNAQAMTIPTPNGGTWTEFPNSPQDNATNGVRGTWFWSRYNGTQGNPTTNDSGSINMGRILAYRGCIASGDPHDVTAGGSQVAATAMSNLGLTTTVDGCMIVICSVCDQDLASSANASGWTNASLVSVDERVDQITATGVGGGHAIADGIKTVAGVVSATTWTQAASGGTANLTIALRPAVKLWRPPLQRQAVYRASRW